jgi:5-(carboxyamino)imidazole ribonucleotide mutase
MKIKKQVPLLEALEEIKGIVTSLTETRTVSLGDKSVTIPEQVRMELELETKEDKGELEIELKWEDSDFKEVPVVSVLMGSKTDLAIMEEAAAVFREAGIHYELQVLSAHRSPERVMEYAKSASERGIEVIIAGAGMAAHLAGLIAANTYLPVIGVPLKSDILGGIDALLSTVQMPKGIPVATVAIDGAKNAAYLALAILARKYPAIEDKIKAIREKAKEGLIEPLEEEG